MFCVFCVGRSLQPPLHPPGRARLMRLYGALAPQEGLMVGLRILALALALTVPLAACAVYVPPRPYPAAVWVPGHGGPYGHWVPGHWA